MSKLIIGVTGSFGAGKSTVCKIMSSFGECAWIEADKLVHRLYLPGEQGYKRISEYFGKFYVSKDGVNRNKLRKIVLAHPQKLWILNKLIHPLLTHEVEQLLKKQYKNYNGFVLLEGIYFEKGDIGSMIDRLILVRRDAKLIKKSRMDLWSGADIEKFIRLQPFYASPDYIIENNGGMSELKSRVGEIYASLLQYRSCTNR